MAVAKALTSPDISATYDYVCTRKEMRMFVLSMYMSGKLILFSYGTQDLCFPPARPSQFKYDWPCLGLAL